MLTGAVPAASLLEKRVTIHAVNTQQQPDETREEFVRRNWNRPGVVANGQTLLDLYARIAQLEQRVSELESARDSDPDK